MANKTPEQLAEEKRLAEVAKKNEAAIQKAEDKIQHDADMAVAVEKQQIESPAPKTETVAKIDAATDEALAIAENKETASGLANTAGGLNLGEMATSQDWTRDDHNRPTHPNDVKFQVAYDKAFKGDRHLEDGAIIVVSREVAEQFTSLGIGSVVA